MAPKHRLLVVGSSNIDFTATVSRAPSAGETVTSNGSYEFVPGGKGANSAVAAARLGADVLFCASLGNDSYGKTLMKCYADEGIDTRYIKQSKAARTGLASILVEDNGMNRIIVYPGANRLLTKDSVEEAFTAYPDALLLQFEIPEEVILASVDEANRTGIPVIVDAGPVIPGFDIDRLGRIEIFSPNETEAFAYTGLSPNNADNLMRISLDLYNRLDVKYIVLKLGGKGCYLYDGHVGEAFPSYYVKAADTTAAGDAFTAALAYEYLRSGNIRSACKYANAVGALTVMKAGALPSLPHEDDVLTFIRENNT